MLIVNSLIIFVVLACIVYFSLRHAWWRPNVDIHFPRILMYHMINHHLPKKQSKFNRLRVPPKEFEKQLLWLKKNGWQSMTMQELAQHTTIPPKTVVLTFDDGYADNYTNAFPLLKKYGMKATIYLVLNRFEKNWAMDKDSSKQSAELNEEPMLTHEMVQEMVQSSLIEFGSHTLNHVNLPTLSYEEKQNEIAHSKIMLEEQYAILCDSFAYPFGFFDKDDVTVVAENGYTNAVTTLNGYEAWEDTNKLQLKRVMISGRQGMIDFWLKIIKGRNR